MQRFYLVFSLALKFLVLSIGEGAYCGIETNSFSSEMQKTFEEGISWAKEASKQVTNESQEIPAVNENQREDQSFQDIEDSYSKCFKEMQPRLGTFQSFGELFVFISFSVPEESLRELSFDLEKVGGAFVMRGLPHNSFQEFFEKTKHLKEVGILAPILIDPEAFETFTIKKVPTFIFKKGETFEKYEGNVPLRSVLREFSESHSVGESAKELLKQITQASKQCFPSQQDICRKVYTLRGRSWG